MLGEGRILEAALARTRRDADLEAADDHVVDQPTGPRDLGGRDRAVAIRVEAGDGRGQLRACEYQLSLQGRAADAVLAPGDAYGLRAGGRRVEGQEPGEACEDEAPYANAPQLVAIFFGFASRSALASAAPVQSKCGLRVRAWRTSLRPPAASPEAIWMAPAW